MTYWWLSFADPDRPQGSQFLGACLIEADDFVWALTLSHMYKLNPGGEVKGRGPIEELPDGWPVHKLMSREEIEVLDAQP